MARSTSSKQHGQPRSMVALLEGHPLLVPRESAPPFSCLDSLTNPPTSHDPRTTLGVRFSKTSLHVKVLADTLDAGYSVRIKGVRQGRRSC